MLPIEFVKRKEGLGGDLVPKIQVIQDTYVELKKRKEREYDMVVATPCVNNSVSQASWIVLLFCCCLLIIPRNSRHTEFNKEERRNRVRYSLFSSAFSKESVF